MTTTSQILSQHNRPNGGEWLLSWGGGNLRHEIETDR